MNKKIMIPIFALAIVLPAAIAYGEEAANTPAESAKPIPIKAVERANMAKEKIEQRQAKTQEMAQKLEAKQVQLQQRKEDKTEQACKNLETRIDTRIKRYENNGKMHENVYGNMVRRVERLVAMLESKGADVTKLKADLATLSEKINKLYTDHEAFVAELKASQTSACGASEGEFKTKVGEARKVSQTIKQDRLDIRNFFQNTVRPDLQAIRQQLAATTNDESEEAAETEVADKTADTK